MALTDDYELGDAAYTDPEYADEARSTQELYRRSRTPRRQMLRQAREGIEHLPAAAEELLLPQSPLDVAAMVTLGPGFRAGTRAGAAALGTALEPSEAEAAMGPGFSKRFFSPLVELIRNLNVNKPLPEKGWRELLEPNPTTGKQAVFRDARTGLTHPVTPDEWEFARGDEALKSLTRNGPEFIHKEDLASLLEEGYPALDTKELGKASRRPELTLENVGGPRSDGTREYLYRTDDGHRVSGFGSTDHEAALDAVRNWEQTFPSTQYSSYRLKGPADDASYQESLTKFERPVEKRPVEVKSGPLSAAEQARLVELDQIEDDFWRNNGRPFTDAELEESRALAQRSPGHHNRVPDGWGSTESASEDFIPRAAHFSSEPNLLAHSRADRRTTVDGLKARHVDELQSDWHQQARDQGGYASKPLTEPELDELHALRKEHHEQYVRLSEGREGEDALDAWMDSPAGQRYVELSNRAETQGEDRPPAAPLRKNWHEVELKKQLAQAIEDGDDLLTLTNGEQQIKRYERGLREAVDSIEWTRKPDGKYDIFPIKNGRPVSVRTAETMGLSDRQLEDTLGTEMAKKIRESEGSVPRVSEDELAEHTAIGRKPIGEVTPADRKRYAELDHRIRVQELDMPEGARLGTLSGPDLAVGGAGMRSFYDRTAVDALKKLAKQYGGEYTRVKLPGDAGARNMWDRRESLLLHSDRDPDRYNAMRSFVRELADNAENSHLQMRADDLYETLTDIEVARNQGNFDQFNRDLDVLRNLLKPEEREQLNKTLYPETEHDVHALKITPAMREKLKASGGRFSLYANGGSVKLPWEKREGFADGRRVERGSSKEDDARARRRRDADRRAFYERNYENGTILPPEKRRSMAVSRAEHDDTPVGARYDGRAYGTLDRGRQFDPPGTIDENEFSELVRRDLRELANGGSVELSREARQGFAGGGRAERQLLDRLRRWLSELGGLPVEGLPEESYKALRSKLKSGEDLLYHGRTIDNRNMGPVDSEGSLFLTAEPGVAEAYARPDTNWNQGSGTSLVVPYRYSKSDVTRLSDNAVGEGPWGAGSHADRLLDLIDQLPPRRQRGLYRFKIEDEAPLSEGLLNERSPEFIEQTYQLREPELRRRLEDDEWPIVDHDQYFAPRASSLRRWKRGGRT